MHINWDPICRKDIGNKKRLRRWSRGHQLFIVRAGGHIDAWQLLYQWVINSSYIADLFRSYQYEQVWITKPSIFDCFEMAVNISRDNIAYPSYNTQAGEQTFVWVSRFKHSIYSVRWTKLIISFIYIVWFAGEICTLNYAISWGRDLSYVLPAPQLYTLI